MKIEEAITQIHIMLSQYAHIRKSDAEFEALQIAEEALRAQMETQKTCEGCVNEQKRRDMDCCWNCSRNTSSRKDLYHRQWGKQ